MDQGTAKPDLNPGVSSPPQGHPQIQPNDPLGLNLLKCICGDDLRKKPVDLSPSGDLTPANDSYTSWIQMMARELSTEGKAIISSLHFNQLEQVYNCGAAHTQIFGATMDHTRYHHCIHAAYSVKGLDSRANLNLSDYELKVLELVMLLHDPHRLGSHELDYVFASIPGAPPIKEWGWGEDFHEYHGAKLVAKDRAIREALGECWADVFAILALPDTRAHNDPTRVEDYGVISPTLSSERLHLLHTLKDEVDRNSYLILDYVRSGIDEQLTSAVIAAVEGYERALDARNGSLQVNLQSEPSPNQAYPFDHLIAARNLFREHVATHPVSCLVGTVLRQAVWSNVQNQFGGNLESRSCYEYIRNLALRGNYAKLFGESVVELLQAPRSLEASLGLEDTYAPLVTLTLHDISPVAGQNALTSHVPKEFSKDVCGIPRADMTLFEYRARDALKRAGLDIEITMVTSNDFEKVFDFQVASPSTHSMTVNRLGVRSSKETIKVIIAAKALDEAGDCIDLRAAQLALKEHLCKSNLLVEPSCLERYNPRAFCAPFETHLFKPEVQARMSNFEPAWITRGGCGLT
jgi:HD superfamily phosphohydrolase